MRITVETIAQAPLEIVWRAWTTPDNIVQWNAATDDWHTPSATIELRPGGSFSYRMEAKDGTVGFDFTGTFQEVVEHQLIRYVMEDDREVAIEFVQTEEGVVIKESFDAETENDAEMQRQGWQAILDNFARHAQSLA